MARCATCGTTILFGGVSEGPYRFCSKTCHTRGLITQAGQLFSEDEVDEAMLEVHEGPCPKCGGPGPVDVHSSYMVWSAIMFTRREGGAEVTCQRCARRRQIGHLTATAVVGWWGFPWGLIFTPITLGQTIYAMIRGPDPKLPSPALELHVRLMLARRHMALQKAAGEHAETSEDPAPE